MTKKVERDYAVYCHRCPVDIPLLMRSQATLHGTPDYGGLWHCPKHTDCAQEPHGIDYCDADCPAKVS